VGKAKRLGLKLLPAEKLQHTKLIEGADIMFELTVYRELLDIFREYFPCVMDVVAVQGVMHRDPILFLSRKDFSSLGGG
jgi:hypothetical protein